LFCEYNYSKFTDTCIANASRKRKRTIQSATTTTCDQSTATETTWRKSSTTIANHRRIVFVKIIGCANHATALSSQSIDSISWDDADSRW
jgi:hypothetical protein